jgi:cell division protein FtsQ
MRPLTLNRADRPLVESVDDNDRRAEPALKSDGPRPNPPAEQRRFLFSWGRNKQAAPVENDAGICIADPGAPAVPPEREPQFELQLPVPAKPMPAPVVDEPIVDEATPSDNLRPIRDREGMQDFARLALDLAGSQKGFVLPEQQPEQPTPFRHQSARPIQRSTVIQPVLIEPVAPRPVVKRMPRWMRRTVRAVGAVVLAAGIAGGVVGQRQGWFVDAGARASEIWTAAAGQSGLTVQAIELSGRKSMPLSVLRHAVNIERGDPILLVDLKALQGRLQGLGWISEARVERVLPGRLRVEIVEREPFARWQVNGQTRLIDKQGVVLELDDERPFRSLRRVVGAGAATQAADVIASLGREPALFNRVTDMVAVRERRWNVVFDNGVVVRLPEDGIDLAWSRLARAQADGAILDRDVVAIDLRAPDRMFVQITPEAAQIRLPPEKKSGAVKRG